MEHHQTRRPWPQLTKSNASTRLRFNKTCPLAPRLCGACFYVFVWTPSRTQLFSVGQGNETESIQYAQLLVDSFVATGDEVLLLRAKEIFENLEETNREDYARLLKHLGTLYSTNGHDPKEAGSEKKNHVLFVMSTWWFEIERKARKFFFVFLAPSSDARSP